MQDKSILSGGYGDCWRLMLVDLEVPEDVDDVASTDFCERPFVFQDNLSSY
jgi:hypothetical protein